MTATATQVDNGVNVEALLGAFAASYAATIGGRERDHVSA